MTTVAGIPHAAIRARERYGIILSPLDIRDMAARCMSGEGLLETKVDGSRYHILIWGERVLWLVYRHPDHGSRHRFGTVITIMPSAVAGSRCRRDMAFRQRRRGWR